MRKDISLFLLVGLVACSKAAPPADPVAERAAVERAITTWFDSALGRLDTAAVRAGLADDFAILEDSVWYDGDGFVELVASLPALMGGSLTLKYTLSDWKTTVEGPIAWTSLTNRAVLTPATGAEIPMAWRETAVLRKSGPRWLLVRYQSAPIR